MLLSTNRDAVCSRIRVITPCGSADNSSRCCQHSLTHDWRADDDALRRNPGRRKTSPSWVWQRLPNVSETVNELLKFREINMLVFRQQTPTERGPFVCTAYSCVALVCSGIWKSSGKCHRNRPKWEENNLNKSSNTTLYKLLPLQVKVLH